MKQDQNESQVLRKQDDLVCGSYIETLKIEDGCYRSSCSAFIQRLVLCLICTFISVRSHNMWAESVPDATFDKPMVIDSGIRVYDILDLYKIIAEIDSLNCSLVLGYRLDGFSLTRFSGSHNSFQKSRGEDQYYGEFSTKEIEDMTLIFKTFFDWAHKLDEYSKLNPGSETSEVDKLILAESDKKPEYNRKYSLFVGADGKAKLSMTVFYAYEIDYGFYRNMAKVGGTTLQTIMDGIKRRGERPLYKTSTVYLSMDEVRAFHAIFSRLPTLVERRELYLDNQAKVDAESDKVKKKKEQFMEGLAPVK